MAGFRGIHVTEHRLATSPKTALTDYPLVTFVLARATNEKRGHEMARHTWRVTEAQKEFILRAIANCPTDAGNGEEETAKHRANSAEVEAELSGRDLWWFLKDDTRS